MMFIGKYLLPKDSGTLNLEIDEEILENETSTQKQIICGIIMVGVIGSMATGIVPLEIAAVVGAVIAVMIRYTSDISYASIQSFCSQA